MKRISFTQHLRKYYFTMYLCETHNIFKAKHPDVTISYPAFCKVKPKNALLLKNTPLDQCRCEKQKLFFQAHCTQDWLLQQFLGTMFMPGEFRRSCDFLLERYMFAMLQRAKDIIWQLWFTRNREISRVDSWWWTNPTPRRKIHRRPQISLLVTFIRFSQLPKHQKDTGIKLWANQIKIWYRIDSDWLCKGILLWVPE